MEKLKIKIKTSKCTRKLYFILKQLYMFFYNLRLVFWGVIFSLFPINSKKIVVVNYNGKGYGDNPKYIVEYLLDISKENYDIIWLVNDLNDSDFPEEIRKVKNESLKAIYELTTAKIWIDNTTKRFVPPKRKKQYYIQTWHAGIGMKKVGIETQNVDKSYLKSVEKDNKNIDVLISNSTYRTNIYRNSFKYKGEILEVGIPRNDCLINKTKSVDNIRKKLNLQNKKVVLYAPTYRKDSIMECYNLDLKSVKDTIEKKYKIECTILVRLHPYISGFKFLYDNVNFLDVSKYPDIMDLLLVSDFVISDYSSLIFDFAITNKPVFLYVPDLVEYSKKEGLNFKIEDLPFESSTSNEDILLKIEKFDEKRYKEDVKKFFETVGLKETGQSCKKIVKIINDWSNENETL